MQLISRRNNKKQNYIFKRINADFPKAPKTNPTALFPEATGRMWMAAWRGLVCERFRRREISGASIKIKPQILLKCSFPKLPYACDGGAGNLFKL